jgi:hypothetical protein
MGRPLQKYDADVLTVGIIGTNTGKLARPSAPAPTYLLDIENGCTASILITFILKYSLLLQSRLPDTSMV